MPFTLAHISDIHLGPLPAVRKRDLLSKRITGYINWKRSRAASMGNECLREVIADIKAHEPDHIAVTGDLVNLALDAEIEAATDWLEALGEPHLVSAVPGNHDAYVRGALMKAKKAWAPWMTPEPPKQGAPATFPYLRKRGNIAIIGVNSAVATPAFVAAGRFGKTQAKKLKTMLESAGRDGLCRVLLIHHPPVRNATVPRKRLYGIGLFQETLAEAGAELVLHGHTHLPQRHLIDGPDGTRIPVVGVPAAGQQPGGKRPAGAWNRIEIEQDNGAWRITLHERSVTAPSGQVKATGSESWLVPAR